MAKKEQEKRPRSILFDQDLWDAIDRDARRCGRSGIKQMEAVLREYYSIANQDLDKEKLAEMRKSNKVEN